METARFWNRVGHWFRGANQHDLEMDPGEVADDEPVAPSADDQAMAPPPVIDDDEIVAASTTRALRQRPTLERLEEEYRRVVNLMDSMHDHLASQAELSGRMERSLVRIADAVSRPPQAPEQQVELLTSISEAVTADAAATKRLEEALAHVPQIADSQRETMVSIGRQLTLANTTSERVAGSMDSVEAAVSRLGEVTDASARSTEGMREDAAVRDQQLTAMVEEQTRRFTLFAWSAIGLAVVAVVIGVVALLQ